jgi:hypothetical protein
MQFLPDGFLQMIFLTRTALTNSTTFDLREARISRSALPGVGVTPQENPARAVPRAHLGRGSGLQRRAIQRRVRGGGHPSWYFHFDSWRTNVRPACGCVVCLQRRKRSALCNEQN